MKTESHVKKSIDWFAQGGMLIVMDNEDRENEGDLIFAAEFCTPEKINFLLTHTGGIICAPLTRKKALQLGLHTMSSCNTDNHGTNFTVSCDHVTTTTGMAAHERSTTLRALVNPTSKAEDFGKPGHIFPLIADPNGLHARKGHTEATVTLCKLAGVEQVGVISELVNPDGTMMRYDDCKAFGQKHSIPIITIDALFNYLLEHPELDTYEYQSQVTQVSSSELHVHNGKETMQSTCTIFRDIDNVEHAVLMYGDWQRHEVVPTRVHSACFTGNMLYSQHCDCQQQYLLSLQKIKEIGYGVLIYVANHEGRGIGLGNKIKAYDLMHKGYDTVQANLKLNFPVDMRDYTVAKDILIALGITKIDLITNNPEKMNFLADMIHGIIQIPIEQNKHNEKYLAAKKILMNHHITFVNESFAHSGEPEKTEEVDEKY